MFSQFPSVTYLKMYQTEFPSFNDFRRALSSLPSLSTLVLYNSNTRWFPLPHHELWQNASPQKRPVLRVFRIRFDLTQEELDVLFHWLLQTPSRLSIRDLAFSTLHLPFVKSHKGPLRQPCIDFVDTVAPSVSTLRIDCREAISLRNFLDLHSLVVDVVPGGWEQLKGLLCDLPSRIRCLQLKSIPVLVLPAAGTLDHVLYDTDFFTEAHRHGVSQLDACLSLDSLSELQTLELVLSVQELRNHLRQEFESSHPYDDRTYWISLLERFTEPSEEYLLLVIEDSIEDDIRNGLTSLRTPGREVEIVMTAHTACILERSPW
ncbi:hypothetical protein BD311DRAFT_810669 [Dichomitus squalens]|uniref:F-box domain-containing protein n=1 Tax=Dichomitus squalens TaxID=114155 RepID=A0A4V2JZ33_9APHY|nr:hypothetical protein BD311DRAFT_810669 [Dichomitus squalens]